MIALAVAAASDVIALWTEFAPPLQWTLDLITAALLFLILGGGGRFCRDLSPKRFQGWR